MEINRATAARALITQALDALVATQHASVIAEGSVATTPDPAGATPVRAVALRPGPRDAHRMECRLCGSEVSRGARGCPRCGLRPPRSGWSTAVLVLGIIAVGTFSAAAGPAIYRHREGIVRVLRHGLEPEPVAAPRPRDPPPPLVEVSSGRLHLDYTANEIAADQRYRRRMLRVTGAVKAIHRDIFDEPYLVLWTTNEFENVDARFGLEWADKLARVKIGDHVAMQCVGAGMTINRPQLQSCSLE